MYAIDLTGKAALVTGASRGLGRAVALALADAGADVAVAARDEAALHELAAEIRERGRRALSIPADLTRLPEIEAMVSKVTSGLGALDILVNNAGLNVPQMAFDVTEDAWDRVMTLNTKSLFFCCQAAGRVMRENGGGRIINMASQMGLVGFYKRAAYCASKHAVLGITKVLAVEWAPYGITVNAVAPTFIETPLTAPMLADPDFRREVLSRIPLGRLGTQDEVAAAVLYLASPAAGLVTGHTLAADGGWTAW